MKLVIMQPYLFPYLGYFQLIAAADRFVFYDDVAFIKKGWVNRNQILLNGRAHLFSVPLEGASSNRAIRETPVSAPEYPRWRERFFKTFEQDYARAPHFESTRALLREVLVDSPGTIGELASRSVVAVCARIGLNTHFVPSSTVYGNGHLAAQERVLDICLQEKARRYINAQGGRELYSSADFAAHGIELRFLRSRLPAYPQFKHEFVPALSILDILMFNSSEEVRKMLLEFELEP